jgi:hydroxymethylbilane synthase
VRIATRASALARWQADHVAALVSAVDSTVDVELVVVSTQGDRDTETPLWEIGGKGVFVKEVQAAVLDGRADVAVHSGKDLPALTPDGLAIVAVPERADARDALVGARLDELSPGAVVATGSVRRRAQLAWRRPDLTFAGLRGNIDTRLASVDDHDAIVLAVAGLRRLGRDSAIAEALDPTVMLPQVAQGALAVECRADDDERRAVLASIEHADSRTAFDAERGFLTELGGDCDLPAAAHATVGGGGIEVTGLLASLDGHRVLRHATLGDRAEAESLGRAVARHLLDHGGAALLGDRG